VDKAPSATTSVSAAEMPGVTRVTITY
jgi:hypothetical protein